MKEVFIYSLVVGELEANAYIVGCPVTKVAVVIDPGAEGERILGAVNRAGYRLIQILLTHGHADHIGGVAFIRRVTGVPVAIHVKDAAMLTDPALNLSFYLGGSFTTSGPDRELVGGERIEVGHFSLQVIHTPGHTPGSVCYLGPGVLFTGDTLFAGSIGRTDFPGGSYQQLLQSIRERLLALPDATVVYPGHGPATTIGEERAHNPFFTGSL